jgi:hypothetical protein
MSNDPIRLDPGTSAGVAAEVRPGGGRPPLRTVSTQIRSAPRSAQIFKIPDEGDPVLQRFILEKIQFHFAVFPFLSIPDSTEH